MDATLEHLATQFERRFVRIDAIHLLASLTSSSMPDNLTEFFVDHSDIEEAFLNEVGEDGIYNFKESVDPTSKFFVDEVMQWLALNSLLGYLVQASISSDPTWSATQSKWFYATSIEGALWRVFHWHDQCVRLGLWLPS